MSAFVRPVLPYCGIRNGGSWSGFVGEQVVHEKIVQTGVEQRRTGGAALIAWVDSQRSAIWVVTQHSTSSMPEIQAAVGLPVRIDPETSGNCAVAVDMPQDKQALLAIACSQ